MLYMNISYINMCNLNKNRERRGVWRYQRGNQNPYIEEEQTTQWTKEKGQKDKQESTKRRKEWGERGWWWWLCVVVLLVNNLDKKPVRPLYIIKLSETYWYEFATSINTDTPSNLIWINKGPIFGKIYEFVGVKLCNSNPHFLFFLVNNCIPNV
jgi:hypothetical protein